MSNCAYCIQKRLWEEQKKKKQKKPDGCCVCGDKGSLVEITFENPDGTMDKEFYCVKHARQEFQKAWKKLA